MDIYLKKLEAGQGSLLGEIEKLCFSLPWTVKQCEGALVQKAFAALGIWRKGALLGYISCYAGGGDMEILNLAVRPEERRKGFARHLLMALLQEACKMGIQKVTLEARESNFPAISLYMKYGFVLAGRRRGYYPDTGEDALIYTRDL